MRSLKLQNQHVVKKSFNKVVFTVVINRMHPTLYPWNRPDVNNSVCLSREYQLIVLALQKFDEFETNTSALRTCVLVSR